MRADDPRPRPSRRAAPILLSTLVVLGAACASPPADEAGRPAGSSTEHPGSAATAPPTPTDLPADPPPAPTAAGAPASTSAAAPTSTGPPVTGPVQITTAVPGATSTTVAGAPMTLPQAMVDEIEVDLDHERRRLAPPVTEAPPPDLTLAVGTTTPVIWIQDDGRPPHICGEQDPDSSVVVVSTPDGLGIRTVLVRWAAGEAMGGTDPAPNRLGSYEATVGPFTQDDVAGPTAVLISVTVLDELGRRADWHTSIDLRLGDRCRAAP